MNLLVTGGAGFIGSRFVELLLNGTLDHPYSSISVVDKLTYSGNLSNLDSVILNPILRFIQADICDRDSMTSIFGDFGIEAVVNFAAESHVDRSIESSFEFLQTNVMGTQNLLEISRKFRVGRFLQISTDEVYGTISQGSWDENEPLRPNSPYSASKAGADLLVLAYGKTHYLNVGITRSCNNYGFRQFPEKLIPLFIANLIDGKKLPIYGEGKQIREWIHVDDHCRAIAKVLLEGEPGHTYNIAGTDELENIEIARRLITYFGKSEAETFKFVEDRKAHDFRYSLKGDKAKSDLNIMPTIEFQNGLESTIEWYIANEKWWRPLLKKD